MNTPVTTPQPIVISMGDPAGIGPEIIAKLFRDQPAEMAGCVVAGDVATSQTTPDAVIRMITGETFAGAGAANRQQRQSGEE